MTTVVARAPADLDWLDDPGEHVDQRLAAEIAKKVKAQLGEAAAGPSMASSNGARPHGQRQPETRAERAVRFARAEIEAHSKERQYDSAPQLTRAEEKELLQDVLDRVLAQGRLTRLLRRDDVVNIHAVGHAPVFVDLTDGRTVQAAALFLDDNELLDAARSWGREFGAGDRQLNLEHPTLNLRLPDRSRLFVEYGLSERPHLFARKHHFLMPRLVDLVNADMLNVELADFLAGAVKARLNILVVGGMDVGKTTLLRALCNEIPPDERIVTVETDYELGLDLMTQTDSDGTERALHPDMVALEARHANIEGVGQVTLADLMPMTMRMSSTRIIVGEALGEELVPLLRAMHAGARGSMSTLHSEPKEVFATLVLLGLMGRTPIDPKVVERLAAAALDLIVFLSRDERGRFVAVVVEVVGWSEDGPATSELWAPGVDGRAVRTEVPLSERLRRRLGQRGPIWQPQRAGVGG